MSLLTWPLAAAIGAVAIPCLLLLYFLKLRRQPRTVSSTLLWKKAVHDMQVNAPFQKLRKNLLLFLQLLLLAAVLFALANPISNFHKRPGENIVLLIDRSASMKSREPDGRSRLDHAKDAAIDYLKSLPDEASVMVISFADRARVETTFTNNRRRLIGDKSGGGIEGIEPTDADSQIGEALQLAVAYSSQLVEDKSMGTPQAAAMGAASIEMFSDGRIADAGEQAVIRGNLRYYRIGEATDNVGIVAFDVRRDLDRPGMLSAFVQVENFGPEAVTTDISISLNGKLLPGSGSLQGLTLGPAPESTTTAPIAPVRSNQPQSSQNVVFEFEHEAGGIIEVKIHREDAFPADNVVWAAVDPPRQARILAVSSRSSFRNVMDNVLRALAVQAVDWKTPTEYANAPEDEIAVDGRSAYDLVIFDNESTDRLPPGNYVFLGGIPKIEGISLGEEITDQNIVTWQENHPLIRPAELDNIYIAKWKRLKLPEHATVLVEGEDSPVMALVTEPGHRYLIMAFDLLDSDLPMKIPFVLIMQNALRYLTGGGLAESGRLVQPGATLALGVPAGASELRITRPDDGIEKIDVTNRQNVSYARTLDVGVYHFAFNDKNNTTESFAVNILSPNESHILPNNQLTLAGTPVESAERDGEVNEPLWPYAVAAALLLLLIEWWIYNRRVML